MRTTVTRPVLAVLAAAGVVALSAAAAAPAAAAQRLPAAAGSAAIPGRAVGAVAELDPSPAAGPVNRAGTSFLGAAAIVADQPVSVSATTGEYLYWSFTASAGEIYDVTTTVTLPAEARRGAQTWIVEVFDGLRRRQPCVAGAQSASAQPTDKQISVRCELRQIRSWAEPWSGDPLPGVYYVRLSASDIPEQDLGRVVPVELLLGVRTGAVTADDGELAAALTPVTRAGAVSAADTGAGTADGATDPAATADDDDSLLPDLPSLSARWFWTAGGGVLAAVAAVVGFALTRRSRRAPVG